MRFHRLREAMASQRVRGQDVANYLGISPQAFSRRLTAQLPFSLADAYKIMDYLGLPHEAIYDYFPPMGLSEEGGLIHSPQFDACVQREVEARMDALNTALANAFSSARGGAATS